MIGRSSASYPGGKNGAGVWQAIINQMPPHDLYIEAFVGAGAVLRHKRPAASTIVIDADWEIAHAWAGEGDVLTAIHGDAISWLGDAARHWTGRELVYCDPPYVRSARRTSRARYRHEMTDADHLRLIEALTRLPCMVMLSGYPSALYAVLLASWRVVTFVAPTRGRPALEHLWCNFPPPDVLHDCRYLGRDFRERERIRRKAARWRTRLDALPPLERQAILSVALIKSDGDRSPSDLAMSAALAGTDDAAGAIAAIVDNGEAAASLPLTMGAGGTPSPSLTMRDRPSSDLPMPDLGS